MFPFPFLVPFSFVLSFRLVVLRLFLISPSSLLFSLPCFPWWRILLFCYLVRERYTPPPRAPCEPEICVFPFLYYILSCVVDVGFFLFFLLFLPFFDFDLDIVCFILSFSCGYYAVSPISVSAPTRLAYDILCILIRTYADLTFLFLSEVPGIRFVSVIMLLSSFFCFPPEVIFRSTVFEACHVTTDCIVAMS